MHTSLQAATMGAQRKIIDVSAVLGVKLSFEDPFPVDHEVDPITSEVEFQPGAYSGLHIHPEQDETFEVMSGRLSLLFNDRWHTLQPGESIVIPKGKVHGWRNSTDEVVRARNSHNPALQFIEHMEEMNRLIRAGKLTGMSGFRNGMYLSLLSMKYRRGIVLARPPDTLIRLMASLGRVLGYRL